MDNWAKNFRSYFSDLSQLLRLISDKATPRDLEKLAAMPGFQAWAQQVASKMAVNTYTANAKSWRDAAAKSGRGRLIFSELQKQLEGTNVGAAMQQVIRDNAELISSLPLTIAERLTEYTAKRRLEGARSKQIQQEVAQWLPKVSESRIRLICRTETSKSESALTTARSRDLGLEWYQWLDSSDQRVRPSHRFMSKVLCRFDDPPAPEVLIGLKNTLGHYGAGESPNCRCLMAPLVSYSEVTWPCRVYHNGKVQMTTLAQFKRINRHERVA